MTNYFYIKQKNGRKDIYRIYYRFSNGCRFVCSFPNEDAAKAKVKQLISEDKQ